MSTFMTFALPLGLLLILLTVWLADRACVWYQKLTPGGGRRPSEPPPRYTWIDENVEFPPHRERKDDPGTNDIG